MVAVAALFARAMDVGKCEGFRMVRRETGKE
jgi:hypothetical protein